MSATELVSTHGKDGEEYADVPAVDKPASPETESAGPQPHPDGGIEAWLQVPGGFCLFFNSWGILNAFGVYQTYYESGQLFEATSSEISWIGSLTAFLLLLTGLFAGPIFDRGLMRSLLAFGAFLVIFGHMMLSLSHQYYQALLSQGICVGIGTGCLFVPAIAVVPQWFSKKLGAAVGIAVSGSAVGGVIYPTVLNKLIPQLGFPWAVRVVGFIALGTLIIPVATMKQRVKPQKPRALLDMSAFTDGGFMAFVFATLVNYMGLFVGFFYLSYYAETNKITDHTMSIYLVSIFNAGSIFGRTVPNIIGDKTGPFNLLAPATMVSGIVMLCILSVDSLAGIVVIALFLGFFSGALVGLPPVCLVALARAENKMPLLGTRIGMAYAMIALGVLVSGPAAGAILGAGDSLDWTSLWIWGGVPTIVSGLFYYVLRFWKYGMNPTTKA